MIDTLRSDFPTDMKRAASDSSPAALESMAQEALDRMNAYAREHPTAFGLCALGVGFVLGWKLKPW
jgi:hypothetical protein